MDELPLTKLHSNRSEIAEFLAEQMLKGNGEFHAS